MRDRLTLGEAVAAAASLVEVAASSRQAPLARTVFAVTFGREPPPDITAFIDLGLAQVGEYEFLACDLARRDGVLEVWAEEISANRIFPVMSDGCGNIHGVYIDDPHDCRVYFFESMDGFGRPAWVSASSIPRLVLAAAMVSRNEEFWNSREAVLAADPFLTQARGAPWPWMAA